jgi:hypothetical protein
METSLQVIPQSNGAMSLKQVADRVNIVHQILEKVMLKGTHFGTVPGCGNRMVLLKPGADVLAMTFRLVPQFQVTKTELENGHREFDVTCSMCAADGSLLGQGVGSCSTMEKKYRYRKDEDGKKTENEDIADVYNTVLKVAKKRAHIDATLTVTGAGDLFTQDLIEDEDEPKKEPVKMPVEKPRETTTAQTVTGIVEDVAEIHSKPDAPKAWTKWGVKVSGETYGTFDKVLGDAATVLKGCAAVLEWKADGKYKVLAAIKPAQSTDDATTDNNPY